MYDEDRTPANFEIERRDTKEKLKAFVRRFVYPIYVLLNGKLLCFKFSFLTAYDKCYYGQRGNDYAAHRRRVNRICSIKGKVILIIGCGTGKDIESWLLYAPKKIIAIDYFNYSRAWQARREAYANYGIEIEFRQASVDNLHWINDTSVDIVASDAVFEHLRDFSGSLKEVKRVLVSGGCLYATYGPLWHSWGGDHISSVKSLRDGYNHLLLNEGEYKEFLETFGQYDHDPNDGRTWIYNDLFSYLKPLEYSRILTDVGFSKQFVSAIIEPRALMYRKKFPDLFEVLNAKHGIENLIVTGMTVIFKK